MIGLKDLDRTLFLFSWWLSAIKTHNAVSFFDINNIAEDLALKLLNEIYDYNLRNLNYEKSNYPGIDLGDEIKKIGFQISSRRDSRKFKECLEKFSNGPNKTYYNGIRFLILDQEKKPKLISEKYKKIYPHFDICRHILTVNDLIRETRRFYDQDKEKFYRIKKILEEEIARKSIEKEERTDKIKKLLTCVVPLREETDTVIETLEYLKNRFKRVGVKIILVDDSRIKINSSVSDYCKNSYIDMIKNRYLDFNKMGAIRTALENIETEYVLLIDADTIIKECDRSLDELILTLESIHRPVDAVSFCVKPWSEKGLLQRFQHLEYTIATDSIKNILGLSFCVSGAASVWRSSSLERLLKNHSGRFEGDDLELTLLAYEAGMHVLHESKITAVTKTPTTWSGLIYQRLRWEYGFFRLFIQWRFWKKLFFNYSKIGALFRAIGIADVLLHPIKLMTFLYPFISYWLATNSSGSGKIPKLLIFCSSIYFATFILGLISNMYMKNSAWEKIKYSFFWIVYTCSPYFVLLGVWLLKWHPYLDLPPRLDANHNLIIPPMQEFLITVGPNIVVVLMAFFFWWLPLSFILLRMSNDENAKKINIFMLLLPFYLFMQIILIRTTALISMLLGARQDPGKKRRIMVVITIMLLFLLAVFSLKIVHKFKEAGDHTEPMAWVLNSIISFHTQSHENIAYIKSYEGWEEKFWVYDCALAVISLVSCREEERACSILNGLANIQNEDGSWYRGYYLYDLGHFFDNRKDVAAIAWVAISALYYQVISGDDSFSPLVEKCFEWLKNSAVKVRIKKKSYKVIPNIINMSQLSSTGNGVTKGTIVVYALCKYAEKILKKEICSQLRTDLLKFLSEVAWNNEEGKFDEFDLPDCSRVKSPSVTVQAWAVLALGFKGPNGEDFSLALDWCEKKLFTSVPYSIGGDFQLEIEGMRFSDEYLYRIYVEGTLQLASGYYTVGNLNQWRKWILRCKIFKSRTGGVFYSIGAGHREFQRRPAVASTCWYYYNDRDFPINPLSPPIENE